LIKNAWLRAEKQKKLKKGPPFETILGIHAHDAAILGSHAGSNYMFTGIRGIRKYSGEGI